MTTRYTAETMRHNLTPRAFWTHCKNLLNKKGGDLESWLSYEEWTDDSRNYTHRYNHTDWDTPTVELLTEKPFEFQCYMEGAYNFIIEFMFDDEKKGTGYMYAWETTCDDDTENAYIRKNGKAAAKATENETTTTEDNKTSMETKQEEKTMTNTNYYDLIKAAAKSGNDYAKKAVEFINEATMDPITITEHAYQLTAYERYCGVDRDDLKKYVAAEFMDDPSVYAINDYLEDVKYYDDIAYSMDDFNEICGSMEPWEIARSCFYGDFKPCDDMFYFNGYGNLTSCSEWEYVNQWRDDVNEWILSEEKTDYMSDEAQEIMDSDNSMAIMISCDALISLGF